MDDSNRIRIIRDWINGDYSQNTSDDELFRNKVTKEITERDIEYTQLLSHFVYITKIRNCLKEFFKWVFLIVIISSIVFFAFKLNSVFDFFNKEATVDQLIEAIPLFITSIVSFVSTIIAIPIAITKYLFSTKEDENITKIILHTQDHDTTGRQWVTEYKDKNSSQQNNTENSDESA